MQRMKVGKIVFGAGVGALITPVAAALAVGSAGAGHGHYVFARLLFPYTMILTRLTGDTITLPLIVLALAQFPLYGLVIGVTRSKSAAILTGALLLIVHAVAAVLCFSGQLPNFA